MKEKGIKILVSIFLFASILMPFSVYAEAVGGSSPIIGVNITYIGYDGEVVPYQTTVHFDTEQTMWRCTSSHSTMGCQVWESENINGTDLDEITGTITTTATSTYTYRLYQYEFIFDKTYVGSITFNGNHPGATTTTTYYVNGNRLVLTDINLVTSFTIGSYNLTYAPLETISKLRQYDFPFESFPYVMSIYQWHSNYIHEFPEYTYFDYPVFDLPVNSLILRGWKTNDSRTYTWIFASSRNIRQDNYTDNLNLPSGFELISWENLDYISFGASAYTKKVTFRFTNGGTSFDITNKTSFDFFVPIFYRESTQMKNISTEFALRYGLSNQFINDLHVIAQGTSQSNSAASGLESSNSTMASDMNSMATIENGYSQDFNSQLQNIDFTNPIQQNQGILPAANFVISIFNGLISNNPFTVLIIIVCILLIGKKVIGK